MASVPLSHAKAELFRALGHPARVQILELLHDGPKTVRQLVEALDVEPANLSQHLAILRRAAVVASAREDGSVIYSLTTSDVSRLLAAGRGILEAVWGEQEGLLAELRATAITA